MKYTKYVHNKMMMKDREFESNKDDRDHRNASSSATDHILSATKDQCESVSAMHHQQQLRKNHQIAASLPWRRNKESSM